MHINISVQQMQHKAPIFIWYRNMHADFSGRAVEGVGLRTLACWDCGFESRQRHGCLSVLSGVCCQVEVSATV